MRADSSPEIDELRRHVPGFKGVLLHGLEEDEELGAFEAASLLARWLTSRSGSADGHELLRQVFEVVERWITEPGFPVGDALAAELVEAAREGLAFDVHMRPGTRDRFGTTR